ncbi:MAG: hypothetical protein ACUZ8A_07145 [Candidatus Bathyanammoxibius sp.]
MLELRTAVPKETDCAACSHVKVCGGDKEKRCVNWTFGTSEGADGTCAHCVHRHGRYSRDGQQCFLCRDFSEQGTHMDDLWCSYCAGRRFKVLPDPKHPDRNPYSPTWECVACGAQFDDNPGVGYFTSYWGDKNTSDTPMKYNPNTGKLVV